MTRPVLKPNTQQYAVLTVGTRLDCFCPLDDDEALLGLKTVAAEYAAEYAGIDQPEYQVRLRKMPAAALEDLKADRDASAKSESAALGTA